MKKITKRQLFDLFHPSVHNRIEALLEQDGTIGIVVFENQDPKSLSRGDVTAMAIGPGCTYKTAAECEGRFIYDTSSQRRYAVAYYIIKEARNDRAGLLRRRKSHAR